MVELCAGAPVITAPELTAALCKLLPGVEVSEVGDDGNTVARADIIPDLIRLDLFDVRQDPEFADLPDDVAIDSAVSYWGNPTVEDGFGGQVGYSVSAVNGTRAAAAAALARITEELESMAEMVAEDTPDDKVYLGYVAELIATWKASPFSK